MTNNEELKDTIDWCIEMVIERFEAAENDIRNLNSSLEQWQRRTKGLTKRLNHLKYLRDEILTENCGGNTPIVPDETMEELLKNGVKK